MGTPLTLNRRHFLGLAAAATTVGPFLRFAPTAAAQGDVVRTTLPNGLTVLLEERLSAETVALQLSARAGSRDDTHPGLTIMTSRMLFQGTTHYPSETDLQRAAQLVGGTISRGTTVETSTFSALMPAREADLGFELLSNLVLDPLFDTGALGRQQQITLQDLSDRLGSPSSYLDDLFTSTLFANHPLSRPVIGTEDGIASVTRADLLAARSRQWGANNLLLTVVGRIRAEVALAQANAYFGALPTGARVERAPVAVAPLQSGRTVRGDVGQQQVQFRLGFPVPGLGSADRYPLTILTALMNGSGGRLFRELRVNRGLAYFAGAGYSTYSDGGAWYATANVDPQNVDEALGVVRDVLRGLRETPPSEGEVRGTAGNIAGRQVLADETNSARASRLASREILGSESIEEFVRRIHEVTPADIQRVAQAYLDPERALVVLVGPGLS